MSLKNWKSAFQVVVEKNKFPALFVILGYYILFVLASKVVMYFGFEMNWIGILAVIALIQLFKFCYLVIEEKNKQA